MKIIDLIRQMIKDYFVIFGILVIGTAFLTPSSTINRDYIILTMIFAAVGDLPSIVFWSKDELSEKSMRVRSLLHLILLEAVILVFAGSVGIVSGYRELFLFAIQILIIYLIVRVITWRGDLVTANKINSRLKKIKLNDEQI